MNVNELKKNISKKTKLVLVNHYGGIPSDTKKIIQVCKKRKIFVLEDAATALGAKLGKNYIGSFNNVTTVFSLQANKIITTGEGGIISTSNKNLAKKLRERSLNGFKKDDVVNHGFKYNFSDINASLGLIQLKKLKSFINYRSKLRLIYDKNLKILEKKNFISLYKKQKIRLFQNIFIQLLLKIKNLADKN